MRIDGVLRIVDRGAVFEAARIAVHLHGCLAAPDFDQEAEVRAAAASLHDPAADSTPLLEAAHWLHACLDVGNPRAPAQSALVRFWQKAAVCAPRCR